MIKKLLEYQIKLSASDMWVSAGNSIMIRKGSKVQPMGNFEPKLGGIIGTDTAEQIVNELYELGGLKEPLRDFAVSYKQSRFRINVSSTWRGKMFTSRHLPSIPKDFSEFNIPEKIIDMANFKNGILFVTGPTGSGKTTTLAAILSQINEKYEKHILTLEDPIEYVFTSKKAFFSQKEVGKNVKSFSDGLRSALRENPDVILVGEVRDYETARLCAEAASTGHFVLTTLHSIGVYETVYRFVSMFPGNEQSFIQNMLGDILRGIVTQILVPRLDEPGKVYPVFEYLVFDLTERAMVKDGKLSALKSQIELKEKQPAKNALSLESTLVKLLQEKIIDISTAINLSTKRQLLQNKARDAGILIKDIEI